SLYSPKSRVVSGSLPIRSALYTEPISSRPSWLTLVRNSSPLFFAVNFSPFTVNSRPNASFTATTRILTAAPGGGRFSLPNRVPSIFQFTSISPAPAAVLIRNTTAVATNVRNVAVQVRTRCMTSSIWLLERKRVRGATLSARTNERASSFLMPTTRKRPNGYTVAQKTDIRPSHFCCLIWPWRATIVGGGLTGRVSSRWKAWSGAGAANRESSMEWTCFVIRRAKGKAPGAVQELERLAEQGDAEALSALLELLLPKLEEVARLRQI